MRDATSGTPGPRRYIVQLYWATKRMQQPPKWHNQTFSFLDSGILPSEDTAAWNYRQEVDSRRGFTLFVISVILITVLWVCVYDSMWSFWSLIWKLWNLIERSKMLVLLVSNKPNSYLGFPSKTLLSPPFCLMSQSERKPSGTPLPV